MSTRTVGRYEVYEAFAGGGMASVHFGRARGDAGFSRIVAVKQLHASFAEETSLVSTLLDEARLVARIRHPNVVSTLDVVVDGADILLVLEYVHGEALSRLARPPASAPPVEIAAAVVAAALHGLHAAHEARAEDGEPLGIVHRDVSPQNILVGVDGLARVLDFGVAKARGRLQTTREGQVKGKLAYMAPEQIRQGAVTPGTDVFAAGIVLWETLTGARLFSGDNEGHVIHQVLERPIPPPSTLRPEVPRDLDEVVLKALDRTPERRFASAHAFALALEATIPIAPPSTIGQWVRDVARDGLTARAERIKTIEIGGGPASGGANRSDARAMSQGRVTSSDDPTRSEGIAPVVTPPALDQAALTLKARPASSSGARSWRWVGAVIVAVAGVIGLVALRAKDEPSQVGPAASGNTAPSSTAAPSSNAAPSSDATTTAAPPTNDRAPREASSSSGAPASVDALASSVAPPESAPRTPARPATIPQAPSATAKPTAPAPAGTSPFYRME